MIAVKPSCAVTSCRVCVPNSVFLYVKFNSVCISFGYINSTVLQRDIIPYMNRYANAIVRGQVGVAWIIILRPETGNMAMKMHV